MEIELNYTVNKTHTKLNNYFIWKKNDCLDYSEDST